MKKFFTGIVVAATMAWSMGIAAVLPVAAAAPVDGDIIKTATNSAVYYVSGGKKMLFVNRGTYSTWSNAIGDATDKFATLKVVSQAEFDALGFGGNITLRPGTNLVKFTDSADVYAVGTGAKLSKLADSAAQTALYGTTGVVTLQSGFRANYYDNGNPVATLTASSKYPDGAVIKSGSDYYLVEGGNRRMITTDAFTANGLKESWARTVADVSAYGSGTNVSGKEAWSAITGSTSAVPTGSATVSLAATSPVASTVISGQAIADLAHFNFSGTGTVTGLKVTKIGIASDATLDKVYLYDGNTKISDAGSVSNGVISFNNPSGLFTINGSKTISVKSDIAGDAGQTVGVSVNSAADITGVSVSGSFPVRGNLMSVARVSDLARATTTMITTGGTTNIDAGTSNVTLWDANIGVVERAVKMKYFTLNMIGSAPKDAIVNAKLYVNGVNVASGAVDSNGVLAFDLGAGVNLSTAGSQLVEVRGEIVKGTDRTFYLSLKEVSDIVLVDSSYNVNIATVIVSGNSNTFSINKGQVSITTDPNFNATQIIRTASNQTLGKWVIKAYGEDAKFMSVKASTTFTGSVSSGDRINDLSIWVNGSPVGSSQSYDLTAGGYKTYGSGNLFTIPAGQEATVEIRGNLSLNASGVTGLGSVLRIEDAQIQGVTSFHTAYTADNTDYDSNPATLTVVDGAVTLEKNSSYGVQTISPNTQAAKIGSFVISAGDTDSVKVTNIKVGLTGSLSFATNTSQLYISETPNDKVNPQATNNFTVDFTLQPNQTKTIDVYANISNVVAELGNTIITTMDITARNGSNAIAYSDGAVTGQTITVNTGSLNTIAKSNDSMSAQYVVGGSSNINTMIVNFRAADSTVIIEEMGFVFGGDASAGAVPVTAITVGGVTKNVASSTATTNVTGLNITVPAGPAGLDVPVAVNYNSVGYGGNIVANKVVSSTLVSIKYRVGSQSVTTTTLSNLPVASDGFLMVSTKPAVAFPTTGQPTTWANGTTRIARITVTADTKGPILLKALPVKFSTTSASFTYTDNLIVKTAAGDTLSTTNGALPVAGTTTIAFGAGLNINAGSTATLDIFVQGAAVVGTPSAGTASIGLELGDKTLFSWRDINGEADITGAYYYSWPVEGVTLSR